MMNGGHNHPRILFNGVHSAYAPPSYSPPKGDHDGGADSEVDDDENDSSETSSNRDSRKHECSRDLNGEGDDHAWDIVRENLRAVDDLNRCASISAEELEATIKESNDAKSHSYSESWGDDSSVDFNDSKVLQSLQQIWKLGPAGERATNLPRTSFYNQTIQEQASNSEDADDSNSSYRNSNKNEKTENNYNHQKYIYEVGDSDEESDFFALKQFWTVSSYQELDDEHTYFQEKVDTPDVGDYYTLGDSDSDSDFFLLKQDWGLSQIPEIEAAKHDNEQSENDKETFRGDIDTSRGDNNSSRSDNSRGDISFHTDTSKDEVPELVKQSRTKPYDLIDSDEESAELLKRVSLLWRGKDSNQKGGGTTETEGTNDDSSKIQGENDKEAASNKDRTSGQNDSDEDSDELTRKLSLIWNISRENVPPASSEGNPDNKSNSGKGSDKVGDSNSNSDEKDASLSHIDVSDKDELDDTVSPLNSQRTLTPSTNDCHQFLNNDSRHQSKNDEYLGTHSDESTKVKNVSSRFDDRKEQPINKQNGLKSTTSSIAKVVRRSHKLDIATGLKTYKEFSAQRIYVNRQPMNPKDRRRKEARFRQSLPSAEDKLAPPQYRLRAIPSRTTRFWRMVSGAEDRDASDFDFVHHIFTWSFNTSFFLLISAQALAFWVGVTFWALLIYFVAWLYPESVLVQKQNFDEAGHYFLDAFQLSWTTFSTVGYGLVHPRVNDEDVGHICIAMNFLTALEAFVGVLFAAMCGSVIFGKVARAKSTANIIFSDPSVIRYGHGVMGEEEEGTATEVKDEDDDFEMFPCPVLEFRLINCDNDRPAGEIINAKISVVARTTGTQATAAIKARQRALENQKKKGKKRIKRQITPRMNIRRNNSPAVVKRPIGSGGAPAGHSSWNRLRTSLMLARPGSAAAPPTPPVGVRRSNPRARQSIVAGLFNLQANQSLRSLASTDPFDDRESQSEEMTNTERKAADAAALQQVAVAEDSFDGKSSLFSKLQIETSNHPFFKRVWVIRHVLNERSPILSVEAKRKINRNMGYWPKEMCNHRDIRKHVKFEQLVAVLSGTQNASGSAVYGMKVYDYVDLNIGYAFSNMLYINDYGRLSVDQRLINDVTEQRGGGGEPLNRTEGKFERLWNSKKNINS